jgi:formylglycine-generating enzyme required for sulfatase activity
MQKIVVYVLILLSLTAGVIWAQKGIRPVVGKDGVLPEEPYRTKWALLIGINKYPNLPVQYQLQYAENDVKELRKVLLEQYQFSKSNIMTLVNEQATYQGIREKFAQLSDSNKIDSNDCVLIYFSGHGQTVPKPRGGDMGFLIPYDAKVDMNNVSSPSAYYATCLGMDELKRLAGMIPAKHVIFLVDACYSGLAVANRGGLNISLPSYLKKVASVPVQQLITAGGKNDVSSESQEWGHGAFTYKLLEALRTGVADENDDGVTTGLELAAYLKNVVPNISPKQTPQYGYFDGEGEFLFLMGSQPIEPIKSALQKTKPAIQITNSDITPPQKDSIRPLVNNQPSKASLPKEITGKDGALMVLIPAGEFQMGSNYGSDGEGEKPRHTVYTDAFYMDKYEVTNAQYKKFVQATGHREPSGSANVIGMLSDTVTPLSNTSSPFNGSDHPVVCISWYDAKAYCDWEKAARGGLVGNEYPWGDEDEDEFIYDMANNDGIGGKDKWKYTSPVGSFPPNSYGLYDMAGNVWEWCADWYDTGYYAVSPKANPKGPSSGVFNGMEIKWRIMRGGSYFSINGYTPKYYLRSACRGFGNITDCDSNVGFRCVQDVPK